MKAFVTQSNYIPWKGFFDALNRADVYVVFDEMQYTKGDWRNRNRIKAPGGPIWLTVPVKYTHVDQKISETRTADQKWRSKHLRLLKQHYSKAPYFAEVFDLVEPLYASREDRLTHINRNFLQAINEYLGIEIAMRDSAEFDLTLGKTERLVKICERLGADTYLVGPSAKSYIDEALFAASGMSVEYLDYTGYPEYPQLHGEFEHGVSILDMLFMLGPEGARQHMLSFD